MQQYGGADEDKGQAETVHEDPRLVLPIPLRDEPGDEDAHRSGRHEEPAEAATAAVVIFTGHPQCQQSLNSRVVGVVGTVNGC